MPAAVPGLGRMGGGFGFDFDEDVSGAEGADGAFGFGFNLSGGFGVRGIEVHVD